MAATASTSALSHNHVESFSPTEWEDEAFVDEPSAAPTNGQNGERQSNVGNLRNAAAALRSSFIALRPRSASSSTVPTAPSSGRRESSTGFVGSLLHGLASAVGMHRENSPTRDVNPGPDISVGRSKLAASQTHTLARLSSAALMRSELQNFSQFGDLRNDSFTSPSCSKLRRRSSMMLPRPSDSCIGLPMPSSVPHAILAAGFGDLSRSSTHAALPSAIASSCLTCPGELPSPGTSPLAASPYYSAAVAATAAALATPPQRERPQPAASPFHSAAALPPGDALGGGAAAAGGDGGGGGGFGLRARRSSCGAPQLHSSLVVEIPSLPAALSPHPPSYPPPSTRPSGSSLSPPASRCVSSEHLPPMTPGGGVGSGGGLHSVRDRPPTPRGSRTSLSGSPSSTLAKVLNSFHLPDIISTSGKSVTERRSSVAGGGSAASFTRSVDFGIPRSRRNSVCSGPSITGPGGAAISASLAKRAAAAASVSTPMANGGGGGLPSPVAPSGASFTCLSRSSGPSVTARTASTSYIKAPCLQHGGILQEFHTSLELDDDKALAAVDANFDRRFSQPSPEMPGAVDGGGGVQHQQPSPPSSHPHLQPLNHPPLLQPPQRSQQQQRQQSDQLVPRAPASERTTPQNLARKAHALGADGSVRGGAAAAAAPGGGGGECPPVFCHASRRQSCSGAPMTTLDDDDEGCDDMYDADQEVLASSVDVTLTANERNSNRMRLASIRLSYAEGIVACPGGGSRRASLDLPPAAAAALTRGSPAGLAPPPPIGARHPAPALPVGAAATAGAAR